MLQRNSQDLERAHINLAPLKSRLLAFKASCGDLVQSFTGTFDPLFQTIAKGIAGIHQQFEENVCVPLKQLKEMWEKTAGAFSAEQISGNYKSSVQLVGEKFKTAVKNAFTRKRQAQKDNSAHLRNTENERTNLVEQLRRQIIGMTGSESSLEIHLYPWWIAIALSVIVGAVALAIDTIGGFKLFQYEGDRITGFGFVLMTSLAATITFFLWFRCEAVIRGFRDALNSFRRIYQEHLPKEERKEFKGVDADGNEVEFFPLSSKTLWMRNVTAILAIGTSMLLVVPRLIACFTSTFAGKWIALWAAIGIVLLSAIVGIIEFWLAPPYEGDRIKQYKSIKKRLEELGAEITEFQQFEEQNNTLYQEYVGGLVETFWRDVEKERQESAGRLTWFRKLREALLKLREEYNEAWKLEQDEYQKTCDKMVDGVFQANANLKPRDFKFDVARIRGFLTAVVVRTFEQPDFWRGVQQFQVPALDFSRIETPMPEQLQKQAETEIIAQEARQVEPEPEQPRIKWQ